MKPAALTAAGSDPSGGAGLQADLKTFHQFGVYGMSVVTLLTVQNTRGVYSVDPLEPEYVERQLDAAVGDITPGAAKTGALGTRGIIEAVARWASGIGFPLVVDPVMISKHGAALMDSDARHAMAQKLLPHAFLVTPNLDEAAALTDADVADLQQMKQAAERIARLGPKAVLVKGGHLAGDAVDVLYHEGRFDLFSAPRLDSKHTHGTGCTYSAAITALLASGTPLTEAVGRAKLYITEAIRTAPGLGAGCGPVNHHAKAGTTEQGG